MLNLSRTDQAHRDALGRLCANDGRLFLHLAYQIVRNVQVAEDVCQQAFAKACLPGTRPDDPTRLRGWLMKIVVNESLQNLRQQQREQRGRARLTDLTRPDQELAQPEGLEREEVLVALEELPELNRVVVLLRIMQGLSGNEVREMLGCSAAEVSRRLYAGMEQLREVLGRERDYSSREHGRER